MAKKTPNQKLLPKLNYKPRGDEGRGGGDYSYMTNGATYNANGDYTQMYGGSGGGGTPPLDSPPQQDPPPQPHTFGEDVGDVYQGFVDWMNSVNAGYNKTQDAIGQNIIEPASEYFFGNGGKIAYPENYQPKVGRPYNVAEGRTPPGWSPGVASGAALGGALQYNPIEQAWNSFQEWLGGMMGGGGGTNNQPPPGGGDPVGRTPPGWSPGVPSGTTGGKPSGTTVDAVGRTPPGWVPTVPPGAPGEEQAARLQDAVNKNQRLTEQAKQQGNDKELARLQAEWDRIAPKAAKYGITAERLVNSYMQPGNPAAESSLDRAMGRAIADDTWANAATIAFGRPPNDVEWREHWVAMNKGGRDPLEGHPQAIQSIQQRMQEIEQENQNEAYGQYQQWLAGQG